MEAKHRHEFKRLIKTQAAYHLFAYVTLMTLLALGHFEVRRDFADWQSAYIVASSVRCLLVLQVFHLVLLLSFLCSKVNFSAVTRCQFGHSQVASVPVLVIGVLLTVYGTKLPKVPMVLALCTAANCLVYIGFQVAYCLFYTRMTRETT